MILSPVEKLRRFLKLELNRNCDNRAVVGGMGKFLPNWQKESGTAGISPELNEAVTVFLNGYGEKDTDGRRASIEEILLKLPPEEFQQRERNRSRRQEGSGSQSRSDGSSSAKTTEKPADKSQERTKSPIY